LKDAFEGLKEEEGGKRGGRKKRREDKRVQRTASLLS
jgi:hypothetical protein